MTKPKKTAEHWKWLSEVLGKQRELEGKLIYMDISMARRANEREVKYDCSNCHMIG